MLDMSLDSKAGYSHLQEILSSPLATFILWGVLSALAYHLVAGVKHLLMDFGIGENKEAAPRMATLVIIISAILIVALGIWLWG
jgi:succinate dehydrogenase / fumarate reductase cytochrome b subunit